MKRSLLTLVCILFIGTVFAQINLVRNGGFEVHDTCPWAPDQIKIAKYWSCIDTAYIPSSIPFVGNPNCSPEYINTCSSWGTCSAPHNPAFYQYPHGGNGMADVFMYWDDSLASGVTLEYKRDYLMGRLCSPLIAGQSYCVTFYVVMANPAAYAVNNIGAYLDDGSIDTNSHCGWVHTEYTPQVLQTTIINDTLNWTKIQGSLIANGTEKYITIGNYTDTAHTAKIRRNYGHGSYYEVDDVSVIATGSNAYAGPDVTTTAGSSTYIGVDSNGDGMPCYWYILGGITPIDSGGTILVHPTDTTTYVVSMDLCGTITYDTATVFVIPCTFTAVPAFTDTGNHTVGFTYTGTTIGMDSVKWNFGDSSMSALTNPLHTYTASGTYTVCVTEYAGCASNTFCRSVNVICPLPAASFTDTGSQTVGFTYTGTNSFVDSIRWSFGDGSFSTLTNPSYTYTATGTYNVCVTVYSSCGNDTFCNIVTVVVPNLGVSFNRNYLMKIKIWPNPANNELHIDNAANCAVFISNSFGQELFKSFIHSDKAVINIASLPKGVYVAQIVNSSAEQRYIKVVKE